jgi:23S rRNA pseudouridine2605 synthase
LRRALVRLLSKAGLCSRTVAAEWIRAGRVTVAGVVVRDPERLVAERKDVRVDGRRLVAPERCYWALNKPRGIVTTRSDPGGRATVYALLRRLETWVVPVGRLDRDTTGLLLLTNDTAFADRVTNPDSHVEKTYRATVRPRLSDEALDRLRAGVVLADGPTRPAKVSRISDRGPTSLIEITITEGRNRQVRRMVQEVGAKVERLARISIGPVSLGDLPAGGLRRLSAAEVRALAPERNTRERISGTRSADGRAPGTGSPGARDRSRRRP